MQYRDMREAALAFFCGQADEDGLTGPIGLGAVAGAVGVSVTTAAILVQRLVDVGAIEQMARTNPGGRSFRILRDTVS
jgi:hypothetical protein